MAGFAETNEQSQSLMASDDPGAAVKAEQLWRSFLRAPGLSADDHGLGLSQLATTLAERGRFKEAAVTAWEGLETAVSPYIRFAVWSELTAVLYKGRRDDRALDALAFIDGYSRQNAVLAERSMHWIHLGRARLLFLSGRVEEAAGVAVRATIAADKSGEARPEAYGIRSDCLEVLGDYEGAIISAMRAAAACTVAKCKSESFLKCFHLHLKKGEYDEAKTYAVQLMELIPSWCLRVFGELNRTVSDLKETEPVVAAELEAVIAASSTLAS